MYTTYTSHAYDVSERDLGDRMHRELNFRSPIAHCLTSRSFEIQAVSSREQNLCPGDAGERGLFRQDEHALIFFQNVFLRSAGLTIFS